MKKRIVTTLIIAALYLGAMATWNTIKSPVTGATTAAQMDDTAASYVVAKGIRENFVENTIGLACAGLVIIIWLVPAKKNNKPKTP